MITITSTVPESNVAKELKKKRFKKITVLKKSIEIPRWKACYFQQCLDNGFMPFTNLNETIEEYEADFTVLDDSCENRENQSEITLRLRVTLQNISGKLSLGFYYNDQSFYSSNIWYVVDSERLELLGEYELKWRNMNLILTLKIQK
jgi:hypothetical protein